jgi:hypothetical protein
MEAAQMTQPPLEDRTPGGILRAIDGGRMLDSIEEERRAAGLGRLELMVTMVMGRLIDFEGASGEEASG